MSETDRIIADIDSALSQAKREIELLRKKLEQERRLLTTTTEAWGEDRAIVNRLPKTADGVPVVDGMELFRRDRFSANDIMPAIAKTDAYWVTHDGQHVVDDSKTFFSTREAAEVEAVEAAGGE